MSEALVDPVTEVLVTSDRDSDAGEPTQRTRLAPHQHDFVAMAFTNGVPPEEIAQAVGCSVEHIRYLGNRNNQSFNQKWDAYKSQLMTETVAWRFRLAKMLPLGYAAIESALTQTKDPKLAADQAWKVLEAVVPQSRPAASPAPGVGLQLNFNTDATVQAQVAGVIQNVGQAFSDLKATIAGVDLTRHVRQGEDALVRLGRPAPAPEPHLEAVSFSDNQGGVSQEQLTPTTSASEKPNTPAEPPRG